jgi:hypothetical protein
LDQGRYQLLIFDRDRLSGSAVVYGVPVSGYANYDDFKSALDQEKSLYKFDLDRKRMSLYVQQSLSDNALTTYEKCLDTTKDNGVIIWRGNTGAFSKKVIVNISGWVV